MVQYQRFQDFSSSIDTNFDQEEFESLISDFLLFLYEANQQLPGPKNPKIKYYQSRKNRHNSGDISAKQSTSSNPQRKDKKARLRRRAQYNFELAQYNYFNRRKKVVNDIFESGKRTKCEIKLPTVIAHFRENFESPNTNILDYYSQNSHLPDIIIQTEDVCRAIKKLSLDTAPGPDHVLSRTIKNLHIAPVLKLIIDIMLKTSYVPIKLREGNTILIDKGGEKDNIRNWRPITIYSIIRRIIEKVLESHLRSQVDLNSNQRGFAPGIPGCMINSKIVNAVIQDARKKKGDCIVSFLDISRAFDSIGHDHIEKSLKALGISHNLHNLLINLLKQNTISIILGEKKSDPINVKRGVPQGGPLSPLLFNIAIDFIYREMCDGTFANIFGYKISENLDAVCLTGFADDQVITSPDLSSAMRAIELCQSLFNKIGLTINTNKSKTIRIKNGILHQEDININGQIIKAIGPGEKIQYLGCNISEEIIFKKDVIIRFNNNLEKLTTSTLLKPNQKLSIINQYLFPMLIFPLQMAPLSKIPNELSNNIDLMIRSSIKNIIGLPANTSTFMFYSPRKLRGLGVMNCTWEKFLQHLSIMQRLQALDDPFLNEIVDFENEIKLCQTSLGSTLSSSKKIRQELRQKSFQDWCKQKWQGIGVTKFQIFPKVNATVSLTSGVSSSEWTSIIKLNTNYANLRGVPGVSSESTLCRRCGKENETPFHVIGSCPHNGLQITSRHHKVKHQLKQLLEHKGYECYDEVFAVDDEGTRRFSDIVAFSTKGSTALIIHPTIRYETNDQNQCKLVQQKKTRPSLTI